MVTTPVEGKSSLHSKAPVVVLDSLSKNINQIFDSLDSAFIQWFVGFSGSVAVQLLEPTAMAVQLLEPTASRRQFLNSH